MLLREGGEQRHVDAALVGCVRDQGPARRGDLGAGGGGLELGEGVGVVQGRLAGVGDQLTDLGQGQQGILDLRRGGLGDGGEPVDVLLGGQDLGVDVGQVGELGADVRRRDVVGGGVLGGDGRLGRRGRLRGGGGVVGRGVAVVAPAAGEDQGAQGQGPQEGAEGVSIRRGSSSPPTYSPPRTCEDGVN